MGLVKTRRLAGGSIRAPLFSKRPRKDSFRRRPRHCAVRHIFEYVTYRVMGESDGHVRRWRDCWTCEDQAAARRGRLAPPGGAAGVRALPGCAEVLPMWECCQFQCCQFPIGD